MDGKAVKIVKNVLPVTLDPPTQKLVELIFSQNMFKEAMECMNLGRYVRILGLLLLVWLNTFNRHAEMDHCPPMEREKSPDIQVCPVICNRLGDTVVLGLQC